MKFALISLFVLSAGVAHAAEQKDTQSTQSANGEIEFGSCPNNSNAVENNSVKGTGEAKKVEGKSTDLIHGTK